MTLIGQTRISRYFCRNFFYLFSGIVIIFEVHWGHFVFVSFSVGNISEHVLERVFNFIFMLSFLWGKDTLKLAHKKGHLEFCSIF